MHQHPPQIPPCSSTSRAKSTHVCASSAFTVNRAMSSPSPDQSDCQYHRRPRGAWAARPRPPEVLARRYAGSRCADTFCRPRT